jgi:ABC-type transport system substrate-binding protein
VNLKMRKCGFVGMLMAACLPLAGSANPLTADQDAFWKTLISLCGRRFEGESVLPRDPGDSFAGKKLVAHVAQCGPDRISVPFTVGTDTSRTWLIRRTPEGLELKHDHRHADGKPDAITLYGGLAGKEGTAYSQAFAADAYTAKLIPDAATNVWTLSLSEDGRELTYYLERHAKPRFKAVLKRVGK